MSSKAQIQTIKADFLDSSLYDDVGLSGVPRLSRGTVLAALSRAFDLAEGRRPGHAQRVAYVGVYLAGELPIRWRELKPLSFTVHKNSQAATWGDGGRAIGANTQAVEEGSLAKKGDSTKPLIPVQTKKNVGF